MSVFTLTYLSAELELRSRIGWSLTSIKVSPARTSGEILR
jgi:hypothetical protein